MLRNLVDWRIRTLRDRYLALSICECDRMVLQPYPDACNCFLGRTERDRLERAAAWWIDLRDRFWPYRWG